MVNSNGAHGQVAILIDEFGEIAQPDRSFAPGLANHFNWMRVTRRAALATTSSRLLLRREHSIHSGYCSSAHQAACKSPPVADKTTRGNSMPSTAPGVTSASLIVIILTGAAIGALVGGIIGTNLETAPLAIASGFIATIVAVIVRNKLLNRFSGVGPDDFQIPMVVAVFAVIASIAGSLASKEVLDQVGGVWSPVWVGTLAGLGSAILMALLMITYHMYPEPRRA